MLYLPRTCSGQQSYVRKILRSYDSSNAGFLSKDKLRVAIDRLAIGLTDTEKGKVRLSLFFCCCRFSPMLSPSPSSVSTPVHVTRI